MTNSLVNIYQEHFCISGDVFQFSCCRGERRGESHASSADEHRLWRWPQRRRYHGFSGLGSGTCWKEPTPKLQGQPQCFPPSVLTFCQSPCCACIDAKSQAGVKVLLSAPQSRMSVSLGEKSFLLFLETCPAPWHVRLAWGPLRFPALVAGLWKASYRCFGIPCWTWATGLGAAEKPCPDPLQAFFYYT